eukprot:5628197-Alexandrium_andersonii.AAC.1
MSSSGLCPPSTSPPGDGELAPAAAAWPADPAELSGRAVSWPALGLCVRPACSERRSERSFSSSTPRR